MKQIQQFPFLRFGSYSRPIIPITLRHKKLILETYGFVDSASDMTIFHTKFAAFLNIDLNSSQIMYISGIKKGYEGNTFGYLNEVEIGVGEYFFKSPVVFSEDLRYDRMGVLGEVGFFDNFVIEFDRAHKIVTLR